MTPLGQMVFVLSRQQEGGTFLKDVPLNLRLATSIYSKPNTRVHCSALPDCGHHVISFLTCQTP